MIKHVRIASAVLLACVAGACLTGSTAFADPFVGDLSLTLRTDDNIADGLQVYDFPVQVTTSTANGVNYLVDPTSPDTPPLNMTRDGDWLQLTAPQPFLPNSNAIQSSIVADGTGGAFLLYTDIISPGSGPNDFGADYATWTTRTATVVAADMLGVWQMRRYGNENLLGGDSFAYTTQPLTITSPASNKLTLTPAGNDPVTFTIAGNQLIPDDPNEFVDFQARVTGLGNIVLGLIDDEDNDPTDLSLSIGIISRVPGDTNFDGDVDDSDLGTAFANYTGPLGDVGKTRAQGDTDFDGDVDDSDLGTAFAGYTGPLSPPSVPEPASLVLIALAGACIGTRRRA